MILAIYRSVLVQSWARVEKPNFATAPRVDTVSYQPRVNDQVGGVHRRALRAVHRRRIPEVGLGVNEVCRQVVDPNLRNSRERLV